IQAPIERCFDLSRSIDLHTASTTASREQAVAGVTTGLIGMGESVTFRARHFGIWLHHTSRITAFDRPHYFRDEMTRGFFRYFVHDHIFTGEGDTTVMRDALSFRSKFGPLSLAIDRLIILPHLRKLLVGRNELIKSVAESGEWKKYLGELTP